MALIVPQRFKMFLSSRTKRVCHGGRHSILPAAFGVVSMGRHGGRHTRLSLVVLNDANFIFFVAVVFDGVVAETCFGVMVETNAGGGDGTGTKVGGGEAAMVDKVGGAMTETGGVEEKMCEVAHLRDSFFRRLFISKRVDSIRSIEAFHSRASIGVDQDCFDIK
ncbi:hypothetical protein Hanom_Chr16g01418681 [Helianthus anomalus]